MSPARAFITRAVLLISVLTGLAAAQAKLGPGPIPMPITTAKKVFKGDSIGASLDPQFRLEIRDPRTSALLWAFTEHVQWAILQGNRNRNFDQASARIVTDVLALAARAVAVTTPANP
jgi:hypothetical protein